MIDLLYVLIFFMTNIIIDVKSFRPMNVISFGIRNNNRRLHSIKLHLSVDKQQNHHLNTVMGSDIHDFKSLSKLAARVDKLLSNQVEFMSSFWSDELNCFQIIPGADSKSNSRVSITSTCLGIKAILDNPKYWSKVARWENNNSNNDIKSNPNSPPSISFSKVVEALNTTPWTFDSFQTPLLVQTFCALNSVNSTDEKFADAIEQLLEQRSRLSLHRSQINSAYLRYQNAKALLGIVESGAVPEHIIGSHRIGFSLERHCVCSFDELCRQLAFYNCGDSGNFDVVILAFSLLNYWETSNSLFLNSFSRGVVAGVNVKLVKASLEVIFACQAGDGTWRKGEPINSKADSKSMRDIGNSYVFFFDLVGSILGPMAEKDPSLIAPYLPQLEKCLAWAEANILEEMLGDVCDPVSNRCYGRVVKGWRSNHLGTGGAVAWCTAQVFICLSGMRKLLQNLMTTNILIEFNGKRETLVDVNPWTNLMDADLKLGPDFETTLKAELHSRLLLPQVQKVIDVSSKSLFSKQKLDDVSSSLPALYSVILFGPPGTAKTTICTSAASYLGWNFVTIDTASFLANGLENVASRMTYIFERLKALEKTIILFDEIEEFCLDRENSNLSMESRMLTTAMLTQLNDLRRQQASIFIVATNRLRSFDAAVTRPGRFDILLFVGTPNLNARNKRLISKLSSTRLNLDERENVRIMVYEVMKSKWDTLRFFTYAENEVLVNRIIDIVNRDEKLDETILSDLINNILRTSTIQGPIQEEFKASEVLSRL